MTSTTAFSIQQVISTEPSHIQPAIKWLWDLIRSKKKLEEILIKVEQCVKTLKQVHIWTKVFFFLYV